MSDPKPVKILFVCMGNICRSPTAEGVFRKLIDDQGLSERFEIDSAGTHAYHVGEPPDRRAQETAMSRGIALSHLRARRVEARDFGYFDYVLAMDQDNYRAMSELCRQQPELASRIRLFMEFAPHMEIREVPDPYYGGAGGFEAVFDMVEEAAKGLLEEIRSRHF
ncbi:MAG: low molecular weight phosphotyrosine protein phosphatase [Thiohalocapsa sp.]|nr:low molecular weight phosphotyrosine protein phosphatase [Thiohalocapsa sp.]MCF7992254.1 low molecular weight phosphotyrosine protein phosphatase [Thiohalocapsa sp.]